MITFVLQRFRGSIHVAGGLFENLAFASVLEARPDCGLRLDEFSMFAAFRFESL